MEVDLIHEYDHANFNWRGPAAILLYFLVFILIAAWSVPNDAGIDFTVAITAIGLAASLSLIHI